MSNLSLFNTQKNMFEILINRIKTIIQANTKISVTYLYERRDFSGDPAVLITPSDNEGDYATNVDNERIYAFNIRIYVKRTTPRTDEDADRIMRDIISTILDDFDKDYFFSGIAVPTGYSMINVFAAPSVWGYSGESDEYRAAEIKLKCRVYVDVTNIS